MRTLAKIKPLQNELVQGICEPSEAGLNEPSKTKNEGPKEMPRETAQEDVLANKTKGDSPDELPEKPAIRESVAEKIDSATDYNKHKNAVKKVGEVT